MSVSISDFLQHQADYLAAWVFYLGCLILALMVFWRFTQGIRWIWLQQSLRTLLALLLLLAVPVTGSEYWLAPAIMVLAMQVLSGNQQEAANIINQYLAIASACCLMLIGMFFWRLRQRQQKNSEKPA